MLFTNGVGCSTSHRRGRVAFPRGCRAEVGSPGMSFLRVEALSYRARRAAFVESGAPIGWNVWSGWELQG
eukprot:12885899-Prorocentrum_lima.AAC.1